jgi:FG-GAP repeat/FG-GAP-like repeat
MRPPLRAATLALALLSIGAGLAPASASAAQAVWAAKVTHAPGVADFNHDGYGDLVIAEPRAKVRGKAMAGHVVIVYGSRNGTALGHRQNLDAANIPGRHVAAGAEFGFAVAAGDFNGDGDTDLAIGSPYADGGRGSVTIFYGGSKGLSSRPRLITFAKAPADARLGGALATGDLTGAGRTDLVVGGGRVLYEIAGTAGSPAATPLASVKAAKGTHSVVATGDLNHDGRADIAWNTGGSLSILLGSQRGAGRPIGTGQVGSVGGLAVADVNGDGFADVVAGDPLGAHGGEVDVFPGSRAGATLAHPKVFSQDSAGVPGTGAKGDEFGMAIAARDVKGTGFAEIVVGAPGKKVVRHPSAGVIVVLPGNPKWTVGTNSWSFTQGVDGVPGVVRTDDRYGRSVTLADLDGDGRLDLAVGAPGENAHEGSVSVYPGTGLAGLMVFGPSDVGAPAKAPWFGFALQG